MSRPWRIRYAGAKYHVTVRGNARREVFHEPDDYLRFLQQLSDALEQDGVILYAYVLLSNHYHLFIETPHGNVQRFMQRLNTAYSMYHRFKHSEPGHCFQGRYGAKLVSGDTYIAALTRYIHLNAVKTAAFASKRSEERIVALRNYPWSSYHGYVNGKQADEFVDYRWLKLMNGAVGQGNRRRYRRYVEAFTVNSDDDFLSAKAVSRYAIGDERFIEQVESDLGDVREDKGVYGDIVWPEGQCVSPEAVAEVVAEAFGLKPHELRGRSYGARVGKKVAVELACLYSGQSQRTVGAYFGYHGNGSVSKQRHRLKEMIHEDGKLLKQMDKLKRKLTNA